MARRCIRNTAVPTNGPAYYASPRKPLFVPSLKIRQAVIVATQDAVVGGTSSPAGSVRVGGISLLKRAILTLSKQGVERFVVATRHAALRDELLDDPSITALNVTWVQSNDESASDGHAVMIAADHLRPGRFLVVPADRVFEPRIASALLERSGRGTSAAVLSRAALQPIATPAGAFGYTGLFTADSELLRELAVRDEERRDLELHLVLSGLAARGALDAVDVGTAYCQPVRDKATRRMANKILLDALRKPVDGLVARHINRNFSLFITRFLKDTPIRPNHITGISLAVAVLGGVMSAWATPSSVYWLIAGAAMWQLASMLDGVDGELARLKFSGSKLGEWLDTLSDDIGRLAFFVGAGIGVANVSGSSFWMYLLFACVAMQLALSVPLYRKLWLAGSGSHFALAWEAKDEASLWDRAKKEVEFLTRRDTYIAMWLAFAIVGWSQFAIAGTTLITFAVVLNEFLSPRQFRSDQAAQPAAAPPAVAHSPVAMRVRPVTPRTTTAPQLTV